MRLSTERHLQEVRITAADERDGLFLAMPRPINQDNGRRASV